MIHNDNEHAPANLLIVEDDDVVRERLVEAFELDGYHARGAGDLSTARKSLTRDGTDLVLLDVNLPDGSGYDLLRDLRSGRLRPVERSLRELPVMMVTGRGAERDRLRAFECECDDYVVKPYSFSELRGRVAAVLRRSRPTATDAEVLDLGELMIDARTRNVTLRGRELTLTQKEFSLLVVLASDPRRVFERADLLESVWGYTGGGRSRTLDAHACRLRAKLSGGRREYVLNCWGVGYRLLAAPFPGVV